MTRSSLSAVYTTTSPATVPAAMCSPVGLNATDRTHPVSKLEFLIFLGLSTTVTRSTHRPLTGLDGPQPKRAVVAAGGHSRLRRVHG